MRLRAASTLNTTFPAVGSSPDFHSGSLAYKQLQNLALRFHSRSLLIALILVLSYPTSFAQATRNTLIFFTTSRHYHDDGPHELTERRSETICRLSGFVCVPAAFIRTHHISRRRRISITDDLAIE